MIRTSETHPLWIDAVDAGAGRGQIGITFAPGKHDPYAIVRDLIGIAGVYDAGGEPVGEAKPLLHLAATPERRHPTKANRHQI